MEKVLFSWSGGKDCAMALHEFSKKSGCAVAALLTTFNSDFDRVSMHGVRRQLLEQQAASAGFLLEKVFISSNATCEAYQLEMKKTLEKYETQGVRSVVFGDIFLEDLRKFREENLSTIGLKGIFPLWKKNTVCLAREFIDAGFKAVITCVDSHALSKEFVGREFDKQFLSELPFGVDCCGENGEFHSFVYDGPIFRNPISFRKGEIVFRDKRFFFQDLIPVE